MTLACAPVFQSTHFEGGLEHRVRICDKFLFSCFYEYYKSLFNICVHEGFVSQFIFLLHSNIYFWN